MNNVTIFNHLGNDIRVTTNEQGDPWFVLKDVCNALGITNTRNVAGRLDGDMKGVRPVDTPGGTQQLTVINEAGLYEVIIRSDKPEAAQFRRWVTSEVLPSIRKHGMYATIEDMIANPDIIIQLATTLKEERAARAKAEAEVEAQRPVATLGRAIERARRFYRPTAAREIYTMMGLYLPAHPSNFVPAD